MNQFSLAQQSSRCLFVIASMVTCLLLLINVSFKIIIVQGIVFAISSIICPLIAGLYLLVLRGCSFTEQRHVLNIALMTLYMFCIGVYVLVNLPATEYMYDHPVYQIIFEDIPKKFFATTISFALSFYLPHLLFCSKSNDFLSSPKHVMFLALLGGLCFFCLDFFFLFSDPRAHSFRQVFFDSLIIASIILLIIGVSYLSFLLFERKQSRQPHSFERGAVFPLFHYLVCLAISVMLMSIACEYRIVAISKECILTASCLFFSLTIMISTLVSELWGYQASLKLAFALVGAQLIFDAFLMGIVALPSPPFFNLNPFYNYIVPRRLPAASLSLFITFISNAMLLHYLRHSKWKMNRPLRILIANTCANSLLCLVDYSLLFGGIYPYEQIINLVLNVWQYKFLMTLLSLPLLLWLCRYLKRNNALVFQPH